MFLTLCSPLSSNGYGSLSRIWSRTTRETQMPPGSANASSRAATFTQSPKIVVFLNDHVAGIDADAEPDSALFGHLQLAIGHPPLHIHPAPDGVDHTRELGKE